MIPRTEGLYGSVSVSRLQQSMEKKMKHPLVEYSLLGSRLARIRNRDHTLPEYSRTMFEYLGKIAEESSHDKIKAEQVYRQSYGETTSERKLK